MILARLNQITMFGFINLVFRLNRTNISYKILIQLTFPSDNVLESYHITVRSILLKNKFDEYIFLRRFFKVFFFLAESNMKKNGNGGGRCEMRRMKKWRMV